MIINLENYLYALMLYSNHTCQNFTVDFKNALWNNCIMIFNPHISKFIKIGAVLFCFMCLFFAINMASKYEYQKTETEIQGNKVRELEEKIRELTIINQELSQIRMILAQDREQLKKEISVLQKKYPELEDWKLTSKNEP